MESFLRRLKFYGIGFGIGLIAVFLIFGNRACNWGPKQRIKNSIKERIIVLNERNDSIRKRNGISDAELISHIEDGDIFFNRSKTENPLRVYHFESESENFNVTIPENSFLSEIVFEPSDAQSIFNSEKGFGNIIYFPKDQDLFYVPKNTHLDSTMLQLGCKDGNDLFELIKKSGKINFNKSRLNEPWNLNHVFSIYTNNKTAEISSIWYKEKIEVTDIQFINHQ